MKRLNHAQPFGPASLLIVAAAPFVASEHDASASPTPEFESPIEFTVGDRPTFVIAEDLDGDGDIDVALTRRDANVAEVFLNDGTGALTQHQTIPVQVWPRGLIAADLDGDGDVDLAVANWATESSSVSILINDGSATFTNMQNVALSQAARPRAVASLDIDNDGDLDLVTANNFGNSLGILINNGAGQFTHLGDVLAGDQPGSLHAGDLNHDGWPDVAVTNRVGDSVSIFLNDGAGNLVFSEELFAGNAPRDEALGDIDGDGDLDLVVAAGGAGAVLLFRNDGAGGFSFWTSYQAGTIPHSVKLEDLNNDARLDLIVGDANGVDAVVRLNTGHGFGGRIDVPANGVQVFIDVADLNGDGVFDLIHVDGALKLRVQMGAPLTGECILGDIDMNGVVNATDLAFVLATWGTDSDLTDLNNDGVVNGVDLAILLSNWSSAQP